MKSNPTNATRRRLPAAAYANRGKSWQTSVEYTLAAYLKRGVGVGWKIPEKVVRRTRLEKNESDAAARYLRAGGLPDYFAVIHGHACLFDAKECTGDRLATSRTIDRQARAMADWAAVGGVAFFLVWTGHGKPALVVDVRWWLDAVAGRKSVAVRAMLEESTGPAFFRGVVPIVPGWGVPVPFADAVVELVAYRPSWAAERRAGGVGRLREAVENLSGGAMRGFAAPAGRGKREK